ncbi:MAG: TIGR02206 family membrane protein [Clostridiales bacterium]|nr:TIGR02206 family membrane protein [Clostridiales bacterium]
MNEFEHFCTEHIVMLISIAVIITAGLLIARKVSDRKAMYAARILSVIVLLVEILQDILLISEGGNLIDFLPLHLCNLGIFVNLAASFSRGKIQSFFAEIGIVLLMPGAVGALLFPDWNYRPFWSYLPLLCFFTHSLLVFIPLLFLVRKKAHISFSHFWYSYLFLLIVVPPIYLLNQRAGVNYMFLMFPPESSPLEWICNFTGEKLYLCGLLALITVILLLEYVVYVAIRKVSKRQ